MTKAIKNIIAQTLIAILTLANVMAQQVELPKRYERTIGKANNYYVSYAYPKAIEMYKKALEISDLDKDFPTLRIADSYRLINENEQAKWWYEKVEYSPVMTKQDMANYAQVLILNGTYDKARQIADSIGHSSIERIDRIDHVSEIRIDTAAYFVENLVVNSPESDFSPAYFEDGVVFVSSRKQDRLIQNKYYWDESYYLDLYYTQNVDSTSDYFTRFDKTINTIYHEGPAVFFDNDQKLIFTRNNFNQGRRSLSEEGVNFLQLFYSQRTKLEPDWSKPVLLPFNSDEYSVGHPSISSDGTRLYFASDMPGTNGKADIYYADLINGVWQTPVNLGDQINTPAEDMFPFIFQDSILFFASKGHLGLGGLDLYSVNLNDSNLVVENLGKPLNTAYDDFGLIRSGNTGYFSSNRPGGKGNDDIYRFIYTEIIPTYEIVVRGVDKETREIIPDAEIIITNENEGSNVITSSLSDSSKTYTSGENVLYAAVAHHHEYFTNHLNFEVGEKLEEDTLFFDIPLEKIEIGKAIVLENIYYDLDKSDIRPDAAAELDKLVTILEENPDIKIELSSHTDSRGSDRYNMALSQRRAESAVAYIVSRGIDAKRLKAKGYGETRLVNGCKNGVKCSIEDHQANRRTEFAVTENEETNMATKSEADTEGRS